MRFRTLSALAVAAALLFGCGGGGGSTSPIPGAIPGGASQVAVQQNLVEQSLSVITATGFVEQFGNPSAPSPLASMRRAMSGVRRPQSCDNGVVSTTTGTATNYILTVTVYYNAACTGQIFYTAQLTVTQTSSTLATAVGSETFYTPGGTVFEFINIPNLTVSTSPSQPYFTLQESIAPSATSPPYQNIAVGCAIATPSETCSLGVANHVVGLNSDNAAIESATISFSTSGGNTIMTLAATGSDFTGPLGSTGFISSGGYGYLEVGGTLVDSVSYTGSFTFTSAGLMTNGSLVLSDSGDNAKVSIAYDGTSYTGTVTPLAGGTTLATFTADANGNGNVTFSNGSSTTIAGFSIVGSGSAVAAAAFTCPTSYVVSSYGRSAGVAESRGRRMPSKAAPSSTGNLIAAVYDRGAMQRSATSFARAESSAGAATVRTFDYPALGKTIHVLAVPAAQTTTAIATLRAQSGVLEVAETGQRRYALTSTPYLVPNTPYFDGFPGANTPPYYETASIPGQWDMHAIGMEYAFGYSTASNTLGTAYPAALGSHSVKLAIIDTGEDPTHPALGANVVYQKCFITSPQDVQSTSGYSTDPLGHGTDVAGIAAAVTGGGIGFAGAGGNSGIYAYRVFPTPDDNCATAGGATDPQCSANTIDIAAAIDDAVAQNASVISMSLGGGGCTLGADQDPVEGTAVQNAIASNRVVIAASGNESQNAVDAPGCVAGVIAVGASALDDGQTNSTGHTGGTAGSPIEYVAGYSNAGATNGWKNASAWGIVAPGGDPANNADLDQLHWIENIWTSTPFMSSSSDTTFTGSCSDDYPNQNSTAPPVDCRTLIAGTSMSTPHVAGVAALVCGLAPAQCTPANMKTLLCATADNLSDARQGCGRLNAYRAVATALGDPSPP